MCEGRDSGFTAQRAVVTADVSEGQEAGGGQLEADSWSPLVVAAARRGRATVPPALHSAAGVITTM